MANLAIIRSLFDYFWRHPEGRANECAFLVHSVRELAGNTEVSQLDVTFLRQQHIGS